MFGACIMPKMSRVRPRGTTVRSFAERFSTSTMTTESVFVSLDSTIDRAEFDTLVLVLDQLVPRISTRLLLPRDTKPKC